MQVIESVPKEHDAVSNPAHRCPLARPPSTGQAPRIRRSLHVGRRCRVRGRGSLRTPHVLSSWSRGRGREQPEIASLKRLRRVSSVRSSAISSPTASPTVQRTRTQRRSSRAEARGRTSPLQRMNALVERMLPGSPGPRKPRGRRRARERWRKVGPSADEGDAVGELRALTVVPRGHPSRALDEFVGRPGLDPGTLGLKVPCSSG